MHPTSTCIYRALAYPDDTQISVTWTRSLSQSESPDCRASPMTENVPEAVAGDRPEVCILSTRRTAE